MWSEANLSLALVTNVHYRLEFDIKNDHQYTNIPSSVGGVAAFEPHEAAT